MCLMKFTCMHSIVVYSYLSVVACNVNINRTPRDNVLYKLTRRSHFCSRKNKVKFRNCMPDRKIKTFENQAGIGIICMMFCESRALRALLTRTSHFQEE